MIIFTFIAFYIYLKRFLISNINRKISKHKRIITFNKSNLNNWMNLTKKERYNLSKKDSLSYFNKRKDLLKEIRKEYKKISNDNSEKS